METTHEDEIKDLKREIRRLNREVTHLKNAIKQEKLAYTTVLNLQKTSSFGFRERERYLAHLLANSPSIILLLNKMGRIEFCTDYFIKRAMINKASDILGHTLSEVLLPIMTEENLIELIEQAKSVAIDHTPLHFDTCFYFGDENVDFAGLLVPLVDDGENNGMILLFHDITVLKRSREEALAASKAKSDFLSNMSHEIRTPLNAIVGMTTIGKKDKNLSGKNTAFEKIETASVHLLGIIYDILDISKIESGKMELSLVHFPFKEMIDRVLNVTDIRVKDKKQNLKVLIDDKIPSIVFGDDHRLAQVITNVLSNASKFTPEHGNITFSVKHTGNKGNQHDILFSVKDTGIGMTLTEKSKLFNIFQQAEAGISRKFGGSGLGLAISKRLLELMGGDIWVESEKGIGSEFFFSVTLEESDPATYVPRKSNVDYHDDFTGYTVLLVDDLEINLEVAKALLEFVNLDVIIANGGKAAVEIFSAHHHRIDLVFMDMQMPEVDGLMATQMIRNLPIASASTVPIIAMTANVFKEDIVKCLEAGMNEHLGKPMEMNEVTRVLSFYLKNN